MDIDAESHARLEVAGIGRTADRERFLHVAGHIPIAPKQGLHQIAILVLGEQGHAMEQLEARTAEVRPSL